LTFLRLEGATIGSGRRVRNGEDVAILTIGHTGNYAVEACEWQSDQMVALSNGCVCCTIADDLGETPTAVQQ